MTLRRSNASQVSAEPPSLHTNIRKARGKASDLRPRSFSFGNACPSVRVALETAVSSDDHAGAG